MTDLAQEQHLKLPAEESDSKAGLIIPSGKADKSTPSLTQAELRELVFPSEFNRGPKGGPETDPSIQHLEHVHRELHRLGIMENSEFNSSAATGAELALLVCRRLHQLDHEPSEDNIRQAVQTLGETRSSAENVPSFAGKEVLVVSHQESLYGRQGSGGSWREAEQGKEISRDANVFGKRDFITSLSLHAGPEGSVQLIRPESASFKLQEKLQHIAKKNEHLLLELVKSPENKAVLAELESAFKAELRSPKPGSPEPAIQLSLSPVNQGWGYLNVGTTGGLIEVLAYPVQLSEQGEPQQIGSITVYRPAEIAAARAAELEKSILDAKSNALDAVRDTKPGPNGFTFIWDGHGIYEHLALAAGVPRQTSEGSKISFDPRFAISVDELSSAIIERSKNYPKAEGEAPDTYFISACLSGDYASQVAEKLKAAGVAVPIFVAAMERNLLLRGDYNHPLGNSFNEFILAPGDTTAKEVVTAGSPPIIQHFEFKKTWDSAPEKEVSIKDYLEELKKDIMSSGGNAVIIAPTNDDSGYMQISDTRATLSRLSPKLIA